MIRTITTAFAVPIFALVAAWPALAITINVGAPVDNTTFTLTGDANSRQGLSSTSILNAGGSAPDVIANAVTASARYQSIAAADNGNGGNSQDQAIVNSDYSVTVFVTAALGTTYSLTIDTRLTGALTIIDDYSLGNGTSGTAAVVSNVVGSLDTIGDAGLNLAVVASTTNGTGSTNDVPINATNQLLTGSYAGTGGPVAHTLRFLWQTRATSNATSSSFDNADEAAARFGLTATITGGGGTFEQNGGIIADNYPGPGARLQSNDGHFVAVTATVLTVPEPGTLPLAGIASLTIGLKCLRRRRLN